MANPVEGVDFLKFRVANISDIFINNATESTPGLLSAADKTALDVLVNNPTQRGSVAFTAATPFAQVNFNPVFPAAKAAALSMLTTVAWPAGTNPAAIPGIIEVNVIPIVDGGGNVTGMYLVPTTSDTFNVCWSAQ